MLKQPTWDNPNKMHIETGHKTFDKQTNLISTGNIIANTMYGSYIRGVNEPDNAGKYGGLFKYDTEQFRKIGVGPSLIKSMAENIKYSQQQTLFYAFFHFTTYKKRILDCVAWTTLDHKLIKAYNFNDYRIMQGVLPYIADGKAE